MEIIDLDEKIIEYLKEKKEILRKREIWRNAKKKLLIDTLNDIKSTYPLMDWYVQILDLRENAEGVNITLKTTPAAPAAARLYRVAQR